MCDKSFNELIVVFSKKFEFEKKYDSIYKRSHISKTIISLMTI